MEMRLIRTHHSAHACNKLSLNAAGASAGREEFSNTLISMRLSCVCVVAF